MEARVVARTFGVHVRTIDKDGAASQYQFVDDRWMGPILSITRHANALMARAGAGCG